jgi:hypothetical protein
VTQWYLNDDEGHLAWLAAHEDGFVLNTYAHIAAGYLGSWRPIASSAQHEFVKHDSTR